MIILWAIIGALYRRYHGGWIEFPHPAIYKKYTKMFLSYALGIIAVYFAREVPFDWNVAPYSCALTLSMGTWIGYGINNMPFHSRGQGADDMLGVAIMSARYLAVTLPVGLAWYFIGGDISGLYYAPTGALVGLAYLAVRMVWQKDWPNDPTDNPKFINRASAVSEMFLGAIVFGGLFLN